MNKSLLIRSIVIGFIGGIALYGIFAPQIINADLNNTSNGLSQATLVQNGRLTFCRLDRSSFGPAKTKKMVVTAYTNIEALTDSSPNTTASNKQVEYGMVATNLFPFGTRVMIPERFGKQVFTVEDRMNKKYNDKPHLDVFLPSYEEAVDFGAVITDVKIEIL